LAAYDWTNPVHLQMVAEVTESPIPTTVVPLGLKAHGMAKIAAVNRTAPAASHAVLGRRRP
jgi:hypothetical protein